MKSDVMPRQRSPRYARVEADDMRLTTRDLAMLRGVQRYRFLRSSHIAELDGGSHQQVLRRLRRLFDHGYLDRPRAQVAYHLQGRNEAMVYGLANLGAEALAHLDGAPLGRLDWTTKNKTAGILFLEHTLMVADFMVALERACQQNPRVRLMDQDEMLGHAPERTRRMRHPLRWRAQIADGNGRMVPIGLFPDRVFSLVFDEQTRANFFLEADRSTMPVARRDLRRTSFRRKLLAYHAGWKAGRHEKQFGWKNFRVLTVTTSRRRLEHMVRTVKEITDGRGSAMFLFTEASLLSGVDPLTGTWIDGNDSDVHLFST